MSQNRDLLDYLKSRKQLGITQNEALINLGIARLASRINDLKNAHNLIDKEMISVVNRDGKIVKVAKYWLIKSGVTI